jgi:hypothetical protein
VSDKIGCQRVEIEQPAPLYPGTGADRASAVCRAAEAAPRVDVVIPGVEGEGEVAPGGPRSSRFGPSIAIGTIRSSRDLASSNLRPDIGTSGQHQRVAGVQ